MNHRGGQYGYYGVRWHKGSKTRPWYGRVVYKGRVFDTQPYATRAEAALAVEILDHCLRAGISIVETDDDSAA